MKQPQLDLFGEVEAEERRIARRVEVSRRLRLLLVDGDEWVCPACCARYPNEFLLHINCGFYAGGTVFESVPYAWRVARGCNHMLHLHMRAGGRWDELHRGEPWRGQ